GDQRAVGVACPEIGELEGANAVMLAACKRHQCNIAVTRIGDDGNQWRDRIEGAIPGAEPVTMLKAGALARLAPARGRLAPVTDKLDAERSIGRYSLRLCLWEL